jgi:hypothetical protein
MFLNIETIVWDVSSTKLDISNLKKCTEDVVRAILESDFGPDDPINYKQLLDRLEASQNKLPPLYRREFFQPFVNTLNELGETEFTEILLSDSERTRAAGLMLDIAHSIIQNGEEFSKIATDSFQEVCSDLYDGFLSAEDRMGVEPPDRGVISPLVKWGRPNDGPYTWPVDSTSIFGCSAAVVSVPPAHARSGLLAWSALGHETAGHDILHADTGLREEISKAVQIALEEQGLKDGLPEYWSSRIDETASDVCGILNMGPAAGIGLIGYFRGLNKAFGGEPKLRNQGGDGPHPADILRGYLAAHTVRLLSFGEANDWAQIIETETNKDLTSVVLEGNRISSEKAKKSAQIVASTLFNSKAKSLENHALGEIQNWRDHDQKIVNEQLIPLLTSVGSIPSNLAEGIFAAHVVAAAVQAALSKDADISSIFSRMLGILKIMHDKNPSWGPLFVRQPSNIYRHVVYSVIDPGTK